MDEEKNQESNGQQTQNQQATESIAEDGMEFLLFLILILLLMSNQNTFNKHFMVLEKEINEINSIFNLFSSTVNGFKTAFTASE